MLEFNPADIILQKNSKYFDFTASGLAYRPIEEKILELLPFYANTHSNASHARFMEKQYQEAKENLKRYLGLNDNFYLFDTACGATGAIKKFQEILGLYIPPNTKTKVQIDENKLPVVIIGPWEHHSNEISFREALCTCERIGLDKKGQINLIELEECLRKNQTRQIIASFSLASNVTGMISDYKKLYALIKSYGGILALDGASASAHLNANCAFFDALFLSPHKLLGGVGSCGLLALRKSLYPSHLPPTFSGGGVVKYVSRTSCEYICDVQSRENAGTPGILQLLRASFAYELRNNIGLENIQKKEEELKIYFIKKLKKFKNVTIYGNLNAKSVATISFNFKDIEHEKLSELLSDKFNIQTRAGCSCAGPYGHDLLGLNDNQAFTQKPGWLRVSLHFSHSFEDIDALLLALQKCLDIIRQK